MKLHKTMLTAVLAAAAAVSMAGCANGGGSGTGSDGSVNLTFWHNGTGDKATTYWANTVKDFQDANPGVTITITVVQNEDLDGKLQTAQQANSGPDIFLQRGGGKMADMIAADQVMDLTDKISADIKTAYGDAAFGFDSLGGKIYAMPMSVQPEGLWYNQDLFDKAGITTNPTDMASFNAAVTKLKAVPTAPIALGGKDAWPAAHWFYSFALRECSKDVVQNLTNDKKFDDPCWLKAFQDVADLNATDPFNQGFLTTPAQQGASSSAGLVANGQAAMELMGAWEPGVIGSLTPDEKNLASLRWFAFPSMPGGQGDPAAIMGGADGYSCKKDAPQACVDFLNFIAAKKYNQGYADAYSTLPANSQAMDSVTDPALKAAAEAYSKAPYVVLWFDTSLGQDVGNAVNDAVVKVLAGTTDAAGGLKLMQAAAANG